jgi:MFS family permease
MLGGVLTGLAFIALQTAADSVAAVTAGWVGVLLSFNATMAAATALMADSISEKQRGASSGVFTAAAFVGTVPPLALAALLPSSVDAISFVMPIAAVIVVSIAMSLPDRPVGYSAPRSRMPRRPALPRAFVAVWLQRLAMQSAVSLAAAFTLYLVIDRMTGDEMSATPVAMIATLSGGAGIVVGAAVGGAWASGTGGFLPFFGFAGAGLAAAAALRAVADTPTVLWIAAAAGGLAISTSLAVNLALAMRVAPADREGTYLGVLNIVETIPQVLVPIAAGALLRVGDGDAVSGAASNSTMLYAVAGVTASVSLLTLPGLRRYAHRDADRIATKARARLSR